MNKNTRTCGLLVYGLLITACRSAAPVGLTVEPTSTPGAEAVAPPAVAPDMAPGVALTAGPLAVPEAAPEAEEAVSERHDGVLLDYYRDDSRGNIQAMESRLKPLDVVHPKGEPID